MHEIGLTDYYFKELLEKNKDYLLMLVNGICGLNLKEEELEIANTEERDSITYKTINYDIKLVCNNIRIDFEAQKEIVDASKNPYGEYSYDINRAIYYASALHSSSYGYKEKGYDDRKSIVVFLYNYDIPGKNYIQLIKFYNKEIMAEYDNIMIFRVSLVKIPENGKIELERALNLLIQQNVETFFNDKSDTIRRAAIMLNEYDKSEKAAMLREARRKAELDRISQLEVARRDGRKEGFNEGHTEGFNEGHTEGFNEGLKEANVKLIKTMNSNGFDAEFISKALSLDLEYVKEVLKKN